MLNIDVAYRGHTAVMALLSFIIVAGLLYYLLLSTYSQSMKEVWMVFVTKDIAENCIK